MSDQLPITGAKVSRRNFLRGAAVGGGALLGVALAGSPATAASKMPQKSAKYQDKPNGHARCDNCKLWQAPASCKLVDGTISPSGWCVLYQPSH